MGSCIATGMCCCFSCCCESCSDAIKRWLGVERMTKFFYILLVIVFVVPGIFVFYFLNQWQSFFDYFKDYISCPESSNSASQIECVGEGAIFRLSLSLLILFTLMFIFMLCCSRCSMILNEGLFCWKYLLVCALIVGSLWIDNDVFANFALVSQYFAILYMFIQSIVLIDLFYLAGIRLVKEYDQGQGRYACYLVTLTLLAEASAITLNVLGYVFTYIDVNNDLQTFPETCANSLWVNIVTTILIVIMPAIQFFNCNPQNSLLTTALVSMFVSYLAFIAQFSFPVGEEPECKRNGYGPLIADVVVSTFFFIMTMYGSIMGGSGQVKVTQNGNVNQAIGMAPTETQMQEKKEEEPVKKQEEDDEDENLRKYTEDYVWIKWHFYMCLASIYIGMLITNWNSASIITGEVGESGFGFWVRVGVCWATFLLYIWTLVAPRVCPDRDFTVE